MVFPFERPVSVLASQHERIQACASATARPSGQLLLAQRPERRADLVREELRLLPCREVPALLDFVEINEVGVGLFSPAARRLILLPGKDAHGYRNRDPLGVEKATLVFPIET